MTTTTDIERITAERDAIRVEQSDIATQMLALSQRLRDLRLAERELTIHLINATFTSVPSIP